MVACYCICSNLPQAHIFILTHLLRSIRQFRDRIMSDSDLSTQLTNSQAASSLCPSIVGLFIQGIESGLVLAEFSRWFSGDRRERCLVSIIAVFVTIVGLYVFSRTLNTVASSLSSKCAVWVILCICLDNWPRRPDYWHRRTCHLSLAFCISYGLLTPNLPLSWKRTGRMTLN